ncbi:surface lipoprotein assembly modifier [Kangiella sediminilitoris]|uniref:DUF560 domain-containing protein n=1 Tax=Kangiella sediminilitoris TaxID=1144748 RepID=A0A1B3B7J3_9GAMM|nr:surface lipoprotein assembly modifier [Kangiella sediminilitoris]AOE48760.1 hypothetical protein KS2013_28 [Kangiella sediminilitoris]
MKISLLTLTLLTVCQPALSKIKSDYEGTIEVGALYNSELVVEEIDQYSPSGDTARYLSLDLGGEWTFDDRFNAKAGFNVSDSDYHDSDTFDLTLQRIYGDLSYEFTELTIGVSQHDINAELADNDFLDMSRSSFYLSKLFNNSIFVRTEAINIDKTFDTLPDRNADNDAIGVDTYFFYNQAKSFFSVGYSSEKERASASEYSYDGDNYRATFSNKFGGEHSQRIQLQWRYYDRDYKSEFPVINTARSDSRNTLKLVWDFYFTPQFALSSTLENTESSSNFESADYTANEVSLLFRVEL